MADEEAIASERPSLSKHCTVAGCDGTMHFHDQRVEAPAPHTLEWSWHATWVCARDSTHFEVVPNGDFRQIVRERERR